MKMTKGTGMNEKCECNSGKKYKKCCFNKMVKVNENTIKAKGRDLVVDGYVVINNRPYKILTITNPISKKGYINLHVRDILTGHEIMGETSLDFTVEVPTVTSVKYTLVDIVDSFLTLMSEEGDEKCDIKLPIYELGDLIKKDFNSGKNLLLTISSTNGESGCTDYEELID
jgi:translation initiation factor 5A